VIRHGLTRGSALYVVVGFVVLGSYGVVVNLVGLDFSRLLGAYVGWFTVAAVIAGKLFFGSRTSPSLWFGVALVLAGSLIIQLGQPTDTP
jgi:small multidrug resistance family-3 protein